MGLILLIVILLLVFGGGFGYYGHARYGPTYGWGGGIGLILLILVLLIIFGGFPYAPHWYRW